MKFSKIQKWTFIIFFSSACFITISFAQTNQTQTLPPQTTPTPTPTQSVSPATTTPSETAPVPMPSIAPATTIPEKTVVSPTVTPATKTITTPWQYTGTNGVEKWGTLTPEYSICATGQSQSPIDIDLHDALPNAQNRLQINYISAPLEIVEDGLSTYKIGTQNVTVNDGQGIQLNFPDPKETITFNGLPYHLEQLHFHTPAENRLNGREFPAEIHFVNQGSNGRLAVIGVFIKAGEKNEILARIINNLPKEKNKVVTVNDAYVNPADLLPATKSHFTFLGSLTTPPCTEGVEWIVMEKPIEATPSQLQQLRHAIDEDNARPVQPLHGRRILHITQ